MSDLASPLSALQLLAQPRGDGIAPVWYIAVAVFIAIFGLLIFIAQRYRRCPSNRVLVIYGRASGGQAAKCVHGGGRFVLPIVEDYDYLSLEPIQIGIPLKDALSMENIRVNVPSVFTVAIGTEPALMQNAAIRLLGLNNTQIHKQAEDIIFGQLRQVIASMPIQDINRDREQFLHNIQGSVEPELRKIGLVLINVNITDITDESGYIEAIGQKAASEAVQKARADVAEQMRIGETRIAETERDKFIQVAEADKVREIGIRQAGREKAVRVAELDKEQKVGEQKAVFEREMQVADVERAKRISVADANAIALVGEQKAAFQREMQVAEVDREKRIAVADANATAFAGEAGAQAKVADAQATLAVKKAEAYRIGETSKRQAEAAVLEAQNIAMAKAALAEAEKVEAERRAELEAPAKAEKARTIVQAEAEAAKRRLEAEGEAAAIFARLEAEAKGQYEILAKKGEGLREIVSACGGAQEAFQLMMLEHLDNLAETAAKAISNIKFDKVIVWENGSGNGTTATSNFLQGMSRSLPPMMQVMKDIGGVELPEFLGRLTPEANGEAPHASTGNGNPDPDESPTPTKREERVATARDHRTSKGDAST